MWKSQRPSVPIIYHAGTFCYHPIVLPPYPLSSSPPPLCGWFRNFLAWCTVCGRGEGDGGRHRCATSRTRVAAPSMMKDIGAFLIPLHPLFCSPYPRVLASTQQHAPVPLHAKHALMHTRTSHLPVPSVASRVALLPSPSYAALLRCLNPHCVTHRCLCHSNFTPPLPCPHSHSPLLLSSRHSTMPEVTDIVRLRFAVAAIAVQIMFALLFGFTTEYDDSASEFGMVSVDEEALVGRSWKVDHYYPMFQDVSPHARTYHPPQNHPNPSPHAHPLTLAHILSGLVGCSHRCTS
jgi:hypothetical protein